MKEFILSIALVSLFIVQFSYSQDLSKHPYINYIVLEEDKKDCDFNLDAITIDVQKYFNQYLLNEGRTLFGITWNSSSLFSASNGGPNGAHCMANNLTFAIQHPNTNHLDDGAILIVFTSKKLVKSKKVLIKVF